MRPLISHTESIPPSPPASVPSPLRILALAAALAGPVACTGGAGDIVPAAAPLPAVALVDERTGRPLGDAPEATLRASASGAGAGTLLARSPDGLTCVFADGRGGHNRAAC